MTRRCLTVALTLLAVTGLAAQGQPHERVVQDTIDGGPDRLAIDNEDGRVVVTTWARDSVAFKARIVSTNDPAPVEQTQIDVDRTGPAMSLATNHEEVEARWSWGPSIYGYGVTTPRVLYTVVAPRSTAIAIDGQGADIEVTGLAARLRIDTQEGRTQVSDQTGSVQVDAQEGTVVLQEVDGDVVVDVQEGNVRMEELSGSIDLEMQEGAASLQFASFDGGSIDTQEGAVTVVLPPEQGVDLSTDLGNEAALDSPLGLSGIRGDGGDYNGAVRDGGPLLQIDSMEGTITLR
jgi:hypothetical protein